MHADRNEKPADPTAPAAGAAEDGAEEAEAVPMNRAERRAKGKHGTQPHAVGKIGRASCRERV